MDIQHGGNVIAFAKEIGCKVSEVIDLSSNINFLKPNIDIDFNALNISAYPNYEELENAIAELYEVKREELELFNGATTAVYTLFRVLNLQHCTLYAPLYLEYEKAAKVYNYELHQVNRFNNMEEEIQEGSLVVFVNPSTPDGKFYDVDKLMKQWIQKNCTIFVDESFLDFTPYPSVSKYLQAYDKLYILKSMTKFYSAAGIRIGALLSQSQNIEHIKEQEPIWKISEFDSCYLKTALKDKSFKINSQAINQEHCNNLIEVLNSSLFIQKVYPSTSNFVMAKLQGINAPTLQKKLKSHKLMIRNCENFKYLDNTYIRVAVKDKKSIKILEKALQHNTL